MSRDEARAAAQVLLAYADGQEVQVRSRKGAPTWLECEHIWGDFIHDEYRIKPKPREWWIVKSADELVISADPVAPIRGHEIKLLLEATH